MKQYYIHNGTEQQGPFTIDDLKSKNISNNTYIWYEGLTDWITADKIDELKDLINLATPPPFGLKTTTPPPFTKAPQLQTISTAHIPKKKNKFGQIFLAMVGLFIFAVVVIFVAKKINDNKKKSENAGIETYQQKVMTVEEIERSQPTNFLSAKGEFRKNLFGTKIFVDGIIKNTATVASYKDVVVRLTYFTKTNTSLGSKDYTIYENFPPASEVNFELESENYENVSGFRLEIINAIPN